MALLPAYILPFLHMAEQNCCLAKVVNKSITEIDAELPSLENLRNTLPQREMKDSSSAEKNYLLNDSKELELKMSRGDGQEKYEELACSTNSECIKQTDLAARGNKHTSENLLLDGVEDVSCIGDLSRRLSVNECVGDSDVHAAPTEGTDIAVYDEDDLMQQELSHSMHFRVEANVQVCLNSKNLDDAAKHSGTPNTVDTNTLQIVPEVANNTRRTDEWFENIDENNVKNAAHFSQEKLEHHVEISTHKPLPADALSIKADTISKPEVFLTTSNGLASEHCFQKSENLRAEYSDSGDKMIRGISDQEVPGDTLLCWTGECDKQVAEDQCFYDQMHNKSSSGKQNPSANFKWKYRPSIEETDETSTSPVKVDGGFSLETVRPLPVASLIRSLRLGLSRRQKVRRLHSFKQQQHH
ncbi:uncharacterized protein LOC112574202 isoform X2 [Pomacea canaliculata]|nr:uncharacterized protein LOC112574202 isoform X2 [Pomacea canaliculata]